VNKNNLNITFFCGGSGCSGFIKFLNNFENIKINLIINGYDYGKSSGKVRDVVFGMLGPSDFRKNISSLMDDNDIIKKILDYRLKDYLEYQNLLKILNNEYEGSILSKLIFNLPFKKYNTFQKHINIFHDHIKKIKKKEIQDKFFEDFSIGNILFGGFYLDSKSFNKALSGYSIFADFKHNIHNVTNGDNLYLYSLGELGKISNEAQIIENTNSEKIEDIYLLKENLSKERILEIEALNYKDKKILLDNLHETPDINSEIISVLNNSDLIIFGPGTQHSSLFPTYLTRGLSSILSKTNSKKIMLTNIYFDNDLLKENGLSLIQKFSYYMSHKKSSYDNAMVDYIFLNKFDEENINLENTKKYFPSEIFKDKKIKMLDFEGQKGKHLPQLVFEEISKNTNLEIKLKGKNSFFLVSIVVPCLNEEEKISKVLENLINLNLNNLDLEKEIIVVDGGSQDQSIQICKNFRDIKVYSLKGKGRGESINYGIKKAKGDIVVTFPSDGEYSTFDIIKAINQLYIKDTYVVYGSRMIKYDQEKYLKKIYKNNLFLYWTSNFGGLLIRLLILIFYNKYIADPFTSLKAFKSDVIKKVKNNFKGVDYDINQIIQLTKNKIYINEIEVNYFPRSYERGKKTNIFEGLKSLLVIFSSLFTKNQKKILENTTNDISSK
tara:strand:+ start:7806 stop:9800 length:1995 start_codon:yes stop_codon:yes gene_type:complete